MSILNNCCLSYGISLTLKEFYDIISKMADNKVITNNTNDFTNMYSFNQNRDTDHKIITNTYLYNINSFEEFKNMCDDDHETFHEIMYFYICEDLNRFLGLNLFGFYLRTCADCYGSDKNFAFLGCKSAPMYKSTVVKLPHENQLKEIDNFISTFVPDKKAEYRLESMVCNC